MTYGQSITTSPQHDPIERQSLPAHRTCSALSASAKPTEDWTQISDSTERRKIQNRIAQRDRRKKLKKRQEDLMTFTEFGSAFPEQPHNEYSNIDSRVPLECSTKSEMHQRRSQREQKYDLPSSSDGGKYSLQQDARQIATLPSSFFYNSFLPMESTAYSEPQMDRHCILPSNGLAIFQEISDAPAEFQVENYPFWLIPMSVVPVDILE